MITISTQDLRPSQFLHLDELPVGIRADMAKLYSSPDKAARITASLINHCFTSRVSYMLISKTILSSLSKTDPNQLKEFELDSALYKRISSLNKSGPNIAVYLAPEKTMQRRHRLASVYVLQNGGLLNCLNLTAEEQTGQMNLVKNIVDSYNKAGLTSLYDPNNFHKESK